MSYINELYKGGTKVENHENEYMLPLWCAVILSVLIEFYAGFDVYEGLGTTIFFVQLPIWYGVFYYLMNKKQVASNERKKDGIKKRLTSINANSNEKYNAFYIKSIDEYIKCAERELYFAIEGYEEDGYKELDPKIKNLRIRNVTRQLNAYRDDRKEMIELGLVKPR